MQRVFGWLPDEQRYNDMFNLGEQKRAMVG